MENGVGPFKMWKFAVELTFTATTIWLQHASRWSFTEWCRRVSAKLPHFTSLCSREKQRWQHYYNWTWTGRSIGWTLLWSPEPPQPDEPADPPPAPDELNIDTRPPTEAEVNSTIIAMKSEKAPGIDSTNVEGRPQYSYQCPGWLVLTWC